MHFWSRSNHGLYWWWSFELLSEYWLILCPFIDQNNSKPIDVLYVTSVVHLTGTYLLTAFLPTRSVNNEFTSFPGKLIARPLWNWMVAIYAQNAAWVEALRQRNKPIRALLSYCRWSHRRGVVNVFGTATTSRGRYNAKASNQSEDDVLFRRRKRRIL